MNYFIKLSIIIPIYNSDLNLLKKSILYIVDSIDIPFEIIIINDGSTNNIDYSVLKKLSPNMIYFEQKNLGVSSARNIGLSLMSGTHFIFLDSDDILCFKDINLEYLLKQNYDIIFFDYYISESYKKIIPVESLQVDKIKTLRLYFENNEMGLICGKIFKISNRQIKFKTDMLTGEDSFFILESIDNSKMNYYYSKPIYKYYYEGQSYINRAIKFPNIILKNLTKSLVYNNQILNKYSFEQHLINKINIKYLMSYVSNLGFISRKHNCKIVDIDTNKLFVSSLDTNVIIKNKNSIIIKRILYKKIIKNIYNGKYTFIILLDKLRQFKNYINKFRR